VKIFGSDYPTPDGNCIRDYVHVSNLASAHVAALDWLAKGRPSQSINLGNGRSFSVAEVCRRPNGRPVRTQMCPRRAGDPPVLVSDSSKARELLGWTPNYPDLDTQIAHAWAWFRDKMPNGRMSANTISVLSRWCTRWRPSASFTALQPTLPLVRGKRCPRTGISAQMFRAEWSPMAEVETRFAVYFGKVDQRREPGWYWTKYP
jgi:hypothetical protein